MDAKFKKTVVTENVRNSLHGWKRRVKARHSTSSMRATGSSYIPWKSLRHKHKIDKSASSSTRGSSSGVADTPVSCQEVSTQQANVCSNFHNENDNYSNDGNSQHTDVKS